MAGIDPERLADALVGGAKRYIDKAMSDVRSRLEALERQANAAAERGFPYRGVWQKAEQYNRGDFTTCDGSMWFCCASTRDRPGSSDAWTLAVKRGQDGKDAGR